MKIMSLSSGIPFRGRSYWTATNCNTNIDFPMAEFLKDATSQRFEEVQKKPEGVF